MVPECDATTKIEPDFSLIMKSIKHGMAFLGKDRAAPVVVGPVTIAYLTKYAMGSNRNRQSLLNELLPVYKSLLQELAGMGVAEIQVHEAALVYEDPGLLNLFQLAYPTILPSGPLINLVSFMGDVGKDHYQWMLTVPQFKILSMDFTRGDSLKLIKDNGFPKDKILGAGLIDARTVWRVDPAVVKPVLAALKGKVASIRVQPSASLQYTPWDLSCESAILKHPAGSVLAFAVQKLAEVKLVEKVVTEGEAAFAQLEGAWKAYKTHVQSNKKTSDRLAKLTEKDFARDNVYDLRRKQQLTNVPILPTTTIGSFPQTRQIRLLRTQLKKGLIKQEEYEAAIDKQIAYMIGVQEALGLDILVHGEPERTDMVEFFATKMEGMLFTTNGWVQSFGSRCVRPPIFWSDIHRPEAMTVREFKVAQDLTTKPVKGMLTGPVTILNWSFPRVDISRKEQAFQIGLAIRDEIADLEDAGCTVIQVDEPALREAMPLRKDEKDEYLTWTVDSFRLATAGAKDSTSLQTHMCYCEFQDCMDAIIRMDTDVNSIENARNDNRTLEAFQSAGYLQGMGPGTYDIHSPVCPPVGELEEKLTSFLTCLTAEQLVVNPDCGLKTRTWPETVGALKNMVEATSKVRSALAAK